MHFYFVSKYLMEEEVEHPGPFWRTLKIIFYFDEFAFDMEWLL